MEKLTLSVRNLVSFLFRSGDIDNRIPQADTDAMAKGSEMHRKLQKEAGGDYRAEVVLSMEYLFEKTDAVLLLQGRADGVFTDEVLPEDAEDLSAGPEESSAGPEAVLSSAPLRSVDEIKTTYRRLSAVREPVPEHLAQGRLYVYMLMQAEDLEEAGLRMTYCNLDTEEVRYFYETWKKEDLAAWVKDVMEQYRAWVELEQAHRKLRQDSIHAMQFPYEYREGQKELAENVYRTIYHGRKLFLNAPTGSGKTIAAMFPALKAMGEEKTERLFYLTARTVTAQVALDTAALLREKQGLHCRSVLITARDRICPLEAPDCNPDACPRAKGHFDRINEALYDLLTSGEAFDRSGIEEAAAKHCVCPFELGLDLSVFADLIVCDYNYVFDPHVYLRRFFGENNGEKTSAVFLIDEAHNLLDRGREMYSAELTREEIRDFKAVVRDVYPTLEKALTGINTRMLALRKSGREIAAAKDMAAGDDRGGSGWYGGQAGRGGKPPIVRNLDDVRDLMEAFEGLEEILAQILESQRKKERKRERQAAEGDGAGSRTASRSRKYSREEEKRELMTEILDFYFKIRHFNLIATLCDPEHYVIYTKEDLGGELLLKLFCVDPSENLKNCMDRGRSAILFSATLLPIQYFKSLLGGTDEDYEIYAHSVFDPERLGLFIARDVTSRYTRRTLSEYQKIADGIRKILEQRDGNYLVFFPSYSFMEKVLEAGFEEESASSGSGRWEILKQRPNMKESERASFLRAFEEIRAEKILAGFCVLGGIFSEGIDLVQDRLIGVIVVGTGLPQVSEERDLLKDHFDERSGSGFDYAYRFPGMNKVLQAAGRVIRTIEDVGIVVLFDERFAAYGYRRLFPAEWKDPQIESVENLANRVERFWDSWL